MKTLSAAAAAPSSAPPFTASSLAEGCCGLCHSVGRAGAAHGRDVPAVSPPRVGPCAPSSLGTAAVLPQGPGALLCMDGAAFWVMKYSQVSDSLRNDGDQSIPFQGVIFFPFTASVSC